MRQHAFLFLFGLVFEVKAQIHDDIKYLKNELYQNDSNDLSRFSNDSINRFWESGVYFISNFSQERNSSFYNTRPGFYSYISLKGQYDFKGLKINFNPSFIFAFNAPFASSFPVNYSKEYWLKWANHINQIDDITQSTNERKMLINSTGTFLEKKIRNKYITFGYDRKKWNVGVSDDLVISENAPAFLNAALKSIMPIHRSKDKFISYDIFLGGVASPRFNYSDNGLKINGKSIIQTKGNQIRGISGFNFLYVNKGVIGFKIGLNGVSTFYLNRASLFTDLLPGINYFSSIVSKNRSSSYKIGSLYVKSSIKEELLDLWFQFGLSNSFLTPNFLILNDTLLTGYLVGARKRLKLGNNFIEFFLQHSNLVNSTLDRALRGESWYTSNIIHQGYSNSGMVIGNGIGPGGVSSYLSCAYISKNKSLGIFGERLMHNQDLFYSLFNDWNGVNNGKYRRHWMDLSLGFYADIIKNFKIHHFSLSITKAFNYQWQIKENWPYFFNKYGIDKWGFNLKYQVVLNRR